MVAKKSNKISQQMIKLRDSLWNDADAKIWKFGSGKPGWLAIPRALPIILRIMDVITKGQPVSSVYLDIWCRSYNNGFVVSKDVSEMALFSGFSGERAQRTWKQRVKKLEELGFIKLKPGPYGDISYILIINPYECLKNLRRKKMINEQLWNALVSRMIEIGAPELEEE